MFDLAELDTTAMANEGFDVSIYHTKTGVDTGIIIRVLGQDSDSFIKEKRRQEKKQKDRMMKGGFRINHLLSSEEQEQDNLKLLAAATIAWRQEDKNTITFEGAELECNEKNVIMIYSRIKDIREQIDRAVGDRANFINA